MRLRLVKVVCQPTFVLEDDEGNLSEQIAEPVQVAAKDWTTYPTTGFQEAVTKLEAALNEPSDDDPSGRK